MEDGWVKRVGKLSAGLMFSIYLGCMEEVIVVEANLPC